MNHQSEQSLTPEELREKLMSFPRVELIQKPTPFHRLERLSRELSGPEIFIKREDMTGLGFGGNKSRKLEYIIPDILAKKADVIVTYASIQSNWCMQTAAAARKFDLIPLLILFRTHDIPNELDGNLLLDHILGARIRMKDGGPGKFIDGAALEEALEEAVNEVREWGHTPYVAPVGGSMPGGDMDRPLGALAYVDAFLEMHQQAVTLAPGPVDYVIHATGSGGTQAGLVVGARALGRGTRILGVSVIEEAESFRRDIKSIAADTEAALGLEPCQEMDDIIVLDEYIREGYGIVDRDVAEAVRRMAVLEGIFIDPVYAGKAFVAFLDLVKKGRFKPADRVVFLHTGGTPALFPNKSRFAEFLSG
jgi:D-cysteine desulfhydrase family pyridoxal phosphate-dependent enzyme